MIMQYNYIIISIINNNNNNNQTFIKYIKLLLENDKYC